MRTSELAARVGLNPQTLRYYERIGLLPVPARTSAGYRDYGDDAVRLLLFVRRAKELGFHLDEVQELLEVQDHGGSCDAVQAVAQRRVADLEERIADLRRMREALAAVSAQCGAGAPDHDRDCPVLDTLGAPRPPAGRGS